MKTMFGLLFLIVVLCNCATSSEVEKAFEDNQIVPDAVAVAPKKAVNVR